MDAVVDNNDDDKEEEDDDNCQQNVRDAIVPQTCSVPTVYIKFTPTIPHCSMATLIGLCIKVKLMRSLNHWNIDVRIKKGTHVSETAINRQLNDKERVKASLENEHLLNVVNKCIRGVVDAK
jgi:metal-sulfur cluster biosynthetic enzyme